MPMTWSVHTQHTENPTMVKKEKGGQPQSDQIILGSGVDFAPLFVVTQFFCAASAKKTWRREQAGKLFFLLARIFSKRLKIATHNIQIMCRRAHDDRLAIVSICVSDFVILILGKTIFKFFMRTLRSNGKFLCFRDTILFRVPPPHCSLSLIPHTIYNFNFQPRRCRRRRCCSEREFKNLENNTRRIIDTRASSPKNEKNTFTSTAITVSRPRANDDDDRPATIDRWRERDEICQSICFVRSTTLLSRANMARAPEA